jgi:hypothetical protein
MPEESYTLGHSCTPQFACVTSAVLASELKYDTCMCVAWLASLQQQVTVHRL